MAHLQGRTYQLPAGAMIVTGGGGALGGAIAAAATQCGAEVAVLDRVGGPEGTLFVECDVTQSASVAAAVGTTVREIGPMRGLVCAAGISCETSFLDVGEAEWSAVIDVSLGGTYHAVHSVLPHMLPSGGSIVAFSSGRTRGAQAGAPYAAAKAGVEGLTRSIAVEFGPRNIRMNALAPGPIRSPMVAAIESFDEAARASTIPLGRIGEPEDVVGPALFLLGSDSAYVTGQVLQVSGGLVTR